MALPPPPGCKAWAHFTLTQEESYLSVGAPFAAEEPEACVEPGTRLPSKDCLGSKPALPFTSS